MFFVNRFATDNEFLDLGATFSDVSASLFSFTHLFLSPLTAIDGHRSYIQNKHIAKHEPVLRAMLIAGPPHEHDQTQSSIRMEFFTLYADQDG